MKRRWVGIVGLLLAGCQAAPLTGAHFALEAGDSPRYRLRAVGDGALTASAAQRTALDVTAYRDDTGFIRDTRNLLLPPGRVRVRFEDVSQRLDPDTVVFGAATPLTILETAFNQDLVSPQRLLEKFVGQAVEVRIAAVGDQPAHIVEAVLVSADGPVVRIDGRIHLKAPGDVIVPSVPAGMVAKPTLDWLLAGEGSEVSATVGYLTSGLSWRADHVLTLVRGADEGALATRFVVDNQTGADLPRANMTLIAGVVRRQSRPPRPIPYMMPTVARDYASAAPEAKADGGFAQEAVGEVHAYTLDRTVDLPDKQAKTLAWREAPKVPVLRTYEFEGEPDGADATKEVPARLILKAKNNEASGLGVALPAGTVRVFEAGADGKPTFVGEDRLTDTTIDGPIRLYPGAAFDIVGTRAVVTQRKLGDRSHEQDVIVRLRNRKDKDVLVYVVERPSGDWRISQSSLTSRRVSANELRYDVRIPAGGDAEVTWTIQFSY